MEKVSKKIEETATEVKKHKRVSFSHRTFFVIVALLLVALSGVGYFSYKYYQATKSKDQVNKEELQRVKALVSRHMVLPTNEEPTLATVSDPEKLRGQAFFAKAEKGDEVLLYSQLQKAILYSVKKDRILEVSPFSTGGQP